MFGGEHRCTAVLLVVFLTGDIMTMIYCFGDSLTDGRPGVTYIRYLSVKSPGAGKHTGKPEYRCINFGVGGDTLKGVTRRLTAKLDHKLAAGDYVIVGVGTNDILLPYFLTCSPSWRRMAKRHIAGGSIPCRDINEFKEKYRQLISYCKKITGNLIIFGLPLLETSCDHLDAKCASYNQEIEAICREMQIPYIDFRAWQIEQKSLLGNEGSFFLASKKRNHWAVALDTLLTTYLPFESRISSRRGLAMTIDGCHLNAFSAKGLADLIDASITLAQDTNKTQASEPEITPEGYKGLHQNK